MKNPTNFKVGDKVILKKSNNGAQQHENKPLIVTRIKGNNQNIMVKRADIPNAGNFYLYYTGQIDEFVHATRKTQSTFLKGKNKELAKELLENKKEIIRLEKFEDDEEEVAYKLHMLLKAKGPKAMATVLRELKKSDYL